MECDAAVFDSVIYATHIKIELTTLTGLNTPSPHLEACVAEWLTPRTPDLDVRGSNLTRRVRQGTLLHFVCLHPGVLMGTRQHTALG